MGKSEKIEHSTLPFQVLIIALFLITPITLMIGLRVACIFGCYPVAPVPLSPPLENAFSFDYGYIGELPPLAIQDCVVDAIRSWQMFLLNSTSPVAVPIGSYCGGEFVVSTERIVEGIYLVVRYEEIESEGVIAQAGICLLVDGMPRVGVIVLDKTYMQELSIYPRVLREIVAHEIGHVLGIGALWEADVDYLVSSRTDSLPGYQYTHAGANAAHVSYGGAGAYSRVEDGGGAGTRGSHWDEAVYDNELMTGYIESGSAYNHLSMISLGALEDLGYHVNYSSVYKLEYRLPSVTSRRLRENKKRYNYTNCIRY